MDPSDVGQLLINEGVNRVHKVGSADGGWLVAERTCWFVVCAFCGQHLSEYLGSKQFAIDVAQLEISVRCPDCGERMSPVRGSDLSA
jgi:DNA-directed RNA polymerase subunit RPC12/RpoP